MSKILLSFTLIFLFTGLIFGQATYVGSQACNTCHSAIVNTWNQSGHPYKFTVIENDQPPTYPAFVMNFQSTWMDSLGDGSHTWADIAGVIGGFGWKTRFVGQDGHVIGTAGSSLPDVGAGHNQINFFGGEFLGWSNYNTSSTVIYNYSCFKCHTTGGDTSGTWLEGVAGLGNFSEGGIACESCHGPGSIHAAAPTAANIDRVYEYAHVDNPIGGLVYAAGDTVRPDSASNDVTFLCGTCHNRSYTYPINSSSGFILHHEQWDEFIATDHYAGEMTCLTCHNPHARSIWNGDGVIIDCETCHSTQNTTLNHPAGVECIDCHMPFAAKSGATRGQSGWKADVRSHIFKITPDTASMFNAAGNAVRDDAGRQASLSPGFACLGCHNDDPNDNIPNKTLLAAATGAVGMHVPSSISADIQPAPETFQLLQNFPNPFNPSTQIEFHMPKTANVKLTVFDINGKRVAELVNGLVNAGIHKATFDAGSLPSGIYFYQILTSEFTQSNRMVLLK